jgi:protein pelota
MYFKALFILLSIVQTRITIRVEGISFDAAQCSLRLNGMNIKENENIKIGQYHTLEIEMSRPFLLTKERWDSISLDLLEDLSNPMKRAEIAAIIMDDSNATISLIQSSMTKICSRIEKSSAKKKGGNPAGMDKATQKFFTDIYQSLLNHLNFETTKVILLGRYIYVCYCYIYFTLFSLYFMF